MKKRTVRLLVIAVIVLGFFGIKAVEHQQSRNLINAIWKNDRERIEYLIATSWNVNATHASAAWTYFTDISLRTPLEKACQMKDYETAKLLIEKGATANAVRFAASSPLNVVAVDYFLERSQEKNRQLLLLLLENGADPNQKTKVLFGYPILNFCERGPERGAPNEAAYLEGLSLLIDYGADVHVQHQDHDIIRICVTDNNEVALAYLLENDTFDIDRQIEFNGSTVLMECAQSDSHINCMKLLLDYGADKTIKNHDGKTAYDLAVEAENWEAVELLK